MKSSHLRVPLRLLAGVLLLAGLAGAQAPRVLRVDIEHVIHPLTAEIVTQAIAQAEREDAEALLIRLHTPGGLLSATQDIIQQIVASEPPVIVYVAPSGGRAASAGFLILMSADVAAMAPGTNTGAAHPVQLGGEMPEEMKKKVENDAAASVRSVASKRGRNADLAEKAVRESEAFTEQEALENNLIDAVADNIPELLAQIDGKTITRFDGGEQTLRFKDAVVEDFQLTLRQRMLLPLTDPNLAFILMVLGILGIYMEFSNPGLIFPGVAGAICVILGMMALSLLPINLAGAALVVLGLACLILEATIVSGGILAAGGVAAMILGAVMLVDTGLPELSINWSTAIAVTLPFAGITIFLLRLAIKSFQVKVATGSESMIGEIGVAKTGVHETGQVFVHGEWWNAQAAEPIRAGTKVRVTAVEGLMLTVEPVQPAAGTAPEAAS